jgi:hypothetical protein
MAESGASMDNPYQQCGPCILTVIFYKVMRMIFMIIMGMPVNMKQKFRASMDVEMDMPVRLLLIQYLPDRPYPD